MLFSDLENITKGKVLKFFQNRDITTLITDSRKGASVLEGGLFFAVAGVHHDGHQYISKLYGQGIRQFVVERDLPEFANLEEANIIIVHGSIQALQQIVADHRSHISAPVIGITGSNGKTIIKEWLYQLLSPDFKIAKNPASYNSQLGVPLSVWQLQSHHTLGIFEAGISTRNEMQCLEKVLKPTIGIFTNIGSAHDEGFHDIFEKISEKLTLFKDTELVIYCKDHVSIDDAIQKTELRALNWGYGEKSTIRIIKKNTHYLVSSNQQQFALKIPFTDQASIENCFHCITVLIHFGFKPYDIQHRILLLKAIPMRLELKEGINRCQIIDDTYNNDLAGLQVSLDFLANQRQRSRKRIILSDIHESGLSDTALAKKISALISGSHTNQFIGIGPVLSSFQNDFPPGSVFYRSTEEFLKEFNLSSIQDEIVLIKGARVFAFEKIVTQLQQKAHGTVMEIDLGALVYNLNFFKACLQPSTKIMAMVKAFAYGSGSKEIANVLQYHKINYLGVAYADEGIELRRNNITLPIMVMNPSEESFATLLKHDLEPEVYNFKILLSLLDFIQGQSCKIHIKIDTGMHRLGFEEDQMDTLIDLLRTHPNLKVASIFTHLAGADEPRHDNFSKEQVACFKKIADRISGILPDKPLYHVLNSPGILRLPEFQFDMVRLGIGLYGIDPTENTSLLLKPVATLKTIISQIKNIDAGESIGYGRRGRAESPMTIATIAIGYADGFSRAFSNGKGKVFLNGAVASVVGNVCMDMSMIDITGIPAEEGDDVIIFGKQLPIQQLAKSIHTIPYEILTSTSERVKRIFVAESI
ncbi:MAG: bifunctional UDP-N-acetylmuramoyl-tripeptide:D-alanyl-D-alanine ligase/alanine racemase [Cyclobacteriaceae bacterium]